MPTENLPWYCDGLAFECTRCGNCCTGAPGYVWVTIDEAKSLSESLTLSLEEFANRYLRLVGDRLSLIEQPTGECIFWDSIAGCRVYESRPAQCRTWPFWPENLASPEDWAKTQGTCPGSGRGRIHSLEEIVE